MIPASIGLPGLPAYELTVTGLPGLTTGVPAYQDSKKIKLPVNTNNHHQQQKQQKNNNNK